MRYQFQIKLKKSYIIHVGEQQTLPTPKQRPDPVACSFFVFIIYCLNTSMPMLRYFIEAVDMVVYNTLQSRHIRISPLASLTYIPFVVHNEN